MSNVIKLPRNDVAAARVIRRARAQGKHVKYFRPRNAPNDPNNDGPRAA